MKYTAGDVIRVLTHNPHNSRLLAGDEVTVRTVKFDEEEDRAVLLVETVNGLRAIYGTDAEIVHAAYRPAVPDAEVDDAFAALLDFEINGDPEFGRMVFDGDTALNAVDERVSAALTPTVATTDEDLDLDPDGEPETEKVDGNVLTFACPVDDPTHTMVVTDTWGDKAAFIYQEAEGVDGEVVGRVMLWTSTEAGVAVRGTLPEVIAWLQEKLDRSRRSQTPPPSGAPV